MEPSAIKHSFFVPLVFLGCQIHMSSVGTRAGFVRRPENALIHIDPSDMSLYEREPQPAEQNKRCASDVS